MPESIRLTRRSLLRAGAAATAVSLVGIRPAPAAAAAAPAHLRRASYAGLTGDSFAVGSGRLRLHEVSDLADRLAGRDDAFRLTFSGPLGGTLESGTHPVSHPRLGTFELFVSPVEQPRSDQRYEAIVDRSVGVPKDPPAPEARAAPVTAVAAAPVAAPRAAKLLNGVRLRRTARGARAVILLRRGIEFEQVHVRLVRRGRTVAVAAHAVHDRRAVLRFRRKRALRAGLYTLEITFVDGAGLTTVRRRRVRLK